VHRGPTVSMGYWGLPEQTARVLRPNPLAPPGSAGELVCFSGDLVKMDEEGFLYFVGRRDNQIKSSGFRISPTEVEQALCRAGPLRDAAVIGVPDGMLGQKIKAFVVPREGAQVDPDGLLTAVATLLPRHMVPHMVEVVDDLPKTTSGKIDYPALRRREEARDGGCAARAWRRPRARPRVPARRLRGRAAGDRRRVGFRARRPPRDAAVRVRHVGGPPAVATAARHAARAVRRV